jgi:hypothetical protein
VSVSQTDADVTQIFLTTAMDLLVICAKIFFICMRRAGW